MALAPEKKKKNKGPMLYFSGTLFVLAGFWMLMNPQEAQDMLTMDEGMVRILTFALLIIGISDIFIAKLFFSQKKIRK